MRPYQPSDLPELNRWYAAHGEPPLALALLPPTGYVVEGVAAGFLYRTDAPGLVLVDGLVTSPDAPIRARARALAEIVERIVALARDEGASRVVGFTRSRGMCGLTERLGFKAGDDYCLMVKGA